MQCRLIQSKALSAVHTMLPAGWCLLSNPEWCGTIFKAELYSAHTVKIQPILAFVQLKTLVLKWQCSHYWLRALCSKAVRFPNELSSLGTLETHCSHFLTAVTTLPYKNTAFTSSDCWRAGGSLLLCVQIHLHICSPHRTRRLDRAPPTVCTNPRVTKNMGRSAAGTFTRRVMGKHILT